MPDLVATLGLVALGFLLGSGAAGLWFARIITHRRAVAGMSGALARFWPETLPQRSAADILAGRIRVYLDGIEYQLPVLPRGATKRWLEWLDIHWAELADQIEAAADDTPRILELLTAHEDALWEILRRYDQTHVLPDDEEVGTGPELLRGVLEVWRAAHPLAAMALEAMERNQTNGTSPEQPSDSPQPTAGALNTSSSS
jgi:hypothetical protein